jgi:hypothetical protein
MRREVQLVIAMPEPAESQRLAALDKLYFDIHAFLIRAKAAALALSAASEADALLLVTSFKRHYEVMCGLYAIVGVVCSLRDIRRRG